MRIFFISFSRPSLRVVINYRSPAARTLSNEMNVIRQSKFALPLSVFKSAIKKLLQKQELFFNPKPLRHKYNIQTAFDIVTLVTDFLPQRDLHNESIGRQGNLVCIVITELQKEKTLNTQMQKIMFAQNCDFLLSYANNVMKTLFTSNERISQ